MSLETSQRFTNLLVVQLDEPFTGEEFFDALIESARAFRGELHSVLLREIRGGMGLVLRFHDGSMLDFPLRADGDGGRETGIEFEYATFARELTPAQVGALEKLEVLHRMVKEEVEHVREAY